MKYQKDQRNGLSLSQVGMGCMRLTKKSEGIKVIYEALDVGINFFNR
ncbi:hypothetical protein SAMN04488072_11938 [Lentibacillus halodurans]|uniref:Aldo/keto reductase family protein n=1 Tax=Lentibacillus halodurans TaxID=237679 RepID=A0A1I1AE59_9BACI|nr:hypothetical protein [Lentibacillus halodurans]SFB36289.1 hypothetical protein SAMN04488072_11938 [Lentibacillus halodurans]